MSDSGSGDRKERKKGGERDDELESKQLNISHKRYYVDVKQNERGRCIKISEMGSTYKSRLILSLAAAVQLRDRLSEMIAHSETLAPFSEKEAADGNTLKSETLVCDSRRYYLDLKENSRGRFLRVAQTVSNPRAPRIQIAIPLQGLTEMRDVLTELLDKYSAGYITESATTNLPKSKSVTAESNKTFYFDVGQNDRGTFVRVSEVKQISGFRNMITIPKSSLESFRNALTEVIQEIDNTPASEPEK